MPSTIGTIRTRGFLVINVFGVCAGRLNSKFSSSVAAIACISMMLTDKIREAVPMRMTSIVTYANRQPRQPRTPPAV